MARPRFGRLVRIPYPLSESSAQWLAAGRADPKTAALDADGVPEPDNEHSGRIIAVEWQPDADPPCVLVTFWQWR